MTRIAWIVCIALAASALLAGCGGGGLPEPQTPDAAADSRATPPAVGSTAFPAESDTPLARTPAALPRQAPLMPAASGGDVTRNAKAEIDKSNSRDGYIMVRFLEETDKELRVTVEGEEGAPPPAYVLNRRGDYEVLPLTQGSGGYKVTVLEAVSPGQYAVALSDAFEVSLTDEFAPFLRPNQYVSYTADSEAVALANELTAGAATVPERVAEIYGYVVENISYDTELAGSVKKGYLPKVDEVLGSGKGICFDYSALMAAMLRSQRIPTKLVIGLAGDVLHAWLNVYSSEEGWIERVVYFDGKSWVLMDPTFASSGGQNDRVMEFIGDGENYYPERVY